MAKLCLLVCIIATTLALTSAISFPTECWLESQVDNILAINNAPASVKSNVHAALAAFYRESLTQTQPNGVVFNSSASNVAYTSLYAYLSSLPATKPTMDVLGANFNAQAPTAYSYCSLGTSALATVNAASLTAEQKAQFTAFIEIAFDVFR